MWKITKNNFKKFSKSNLLPNPDGSKPNSEVANNMFEKNQELLSTFQRDYDSLSELRENRARCVRYFFGDQLSDSIPDPDGCGNITEEVYIRRQGITPMSMNIMEEPITNVISLFRRANLEPMAISRGRDETKLGEMMSIALEYVYQNQQVLQINADGFKEFMLSGIPAFRVGWDWVSRQEASDVVVKQCDINRMAWDDNTSGLYFENITRIGYLHDMPLSKVLKNWAHSASEKARIIQIYQECQGLYAGFGQQHQRDERKRQISFNHPLNPNDCRVIEIWTKESSDCLACHDIAKGDPYTVPLEDEPIIIAENNRRKMEFVQAGGRVEDTPVIEYDYKVDEVWVVRYLSPTGYVLHQEVSPYWHKSHPFAIGGFPLVDGEIHSVAEKMIPIQRVFSITFMRNNFIRMNEAKGFGIVQKKVLDKSGVTLEEFAAKYTSPNAMMALDWEDGADVFKLFNERSTSTTDEKTMQMCLELVDKISGNTGAIRGEAPKAGTPSSLYAQQVENSATNMEDLIGWYKGLILERDYKIMSVIQQYYDRPRHLNIVGKNYSEESKYYNPQKVRNSKFDLALVERSTSGIKRLDEESVLDKLVDRQVVPPEIVLEFSSDPLARQILERMKNYKQELMDAAGAMTPAPSAPGAAMAQAVPEAQAPSIMPE